jgi:hypothetical protein
MLTVAEREPVAVGVNVTPIEQFPPAATLDPQLFVCRKSLGLAPPTEIPVMLSAALPELVSIKLCVRLAVPWFFELKVRLLGEIAAEGAAVVPVLTLPPPPPQPAHIKTSIVAAVRPSHVGCLPRPAIIPSQASMRKVPRTRPTHRKVKRHRRETGRAGIDFGTRGVRAVAVVATLIFAVTADEPLKGKEAGVAMQFAPVGAPEHAKVTVPLKPPTGVKTSE